MSQHDLVSSDNYAEDMVAL